ncbi:MAG: MFS transporter [Micropepsaceae bacterium]
MSGSRSLIAALAALQALLLTNNALTFFLAPLIGVVLAPNPAFATVPLTAFVVGAATTTLPMSLLMKRLGRRAGFLLGAFIGLCGAALSALALIQESFVLFLAAAFCGGSYSATGQYYRFAAAEAVGVHARGRAISLVLFGGLAGAFVGPETAIFTRDLLPTAYLASYIALVGFALASCVLLFFIRFPDPAKHDPTAGAPARPLSAILAQPPIVAAMLGAIVGYAVMNFLMTSTSLAMTIHNHAGEDAAFVIEWHIVAMFAPSLFTGRLIQRFGTTLVMSCGALLMMATVAVAVGGTSLAAFWSALALLGVGWNFLYIGGTTLLAASHRSSERGKVQGLNDMLVFVGTGASSMLSGALLHFAGWQTMVLVTLPLPLLALVVLCWARSRPEPDAA